MNLFCDSEVSPGQIEGVDIAGVNGQYNVSFNSTFACPSTPTPSPCPSGFSGIFGGYGYAGFCWYFSASPSGSTCDSVCAAVGGANLANNATNAFVGSGIPVATDVTSVIYKQFGNPGNWNGPSTSSAGSCNTLGSIFIYVIHNTQSHSPPGWADHEGSSFDGLFFGKLLTGTLQCGTFPGDTNSWNVTPVCPCSSQAVLQ